MKTIDLRKNPNQEIPKNFTGKVTYVSGYVYYLKNGKLHRENGPAFICARYKEYYKNGKLHRENGPAVEWTNGYKEYYINDKRHREDGPATEYVDGLVTYYYNGKKCSKKKLERLIKSKDGQIIKIDGMKYKLTLV